jgi:mannose-6-phosphate isomerase-like protein (cupin superfamily)
MIITKYQHQLIKETPHKIDVREMYNKDSAQAMLMALKPGESLKPHKTPVDVFFFIVEGTPTIHIGNESEVCESDSLIESPANIVHYISNNSENLARVLVVKAPRPSSQTKVL